MKTFASAAPPESANVGSAAARAQGVRREPDGQVVLLEAVAAVRLLHLGLDLALAELGREGDRLEHLLNQIGELSLVLRARLGEEGAPLRDDVPRGPAVDDADIRRRLVVDTAEAEVGDALAAAAIAERPSSGIHARMGRPPVEPNLHRVRVRRAEDDLADRRGLVVDIADRAASRRRRTRPRRGGRPPPWA